MSKTDQQLTGFVEWFRNSSPYIHAHRDKTLVITFGGEAVADQGFPNLIHDIALLQGLGLRIVIIHGARPQIEQRLAQRGAEMQYINALRVTDDIALACVKEAAGAVRVEIEALLSLGVTNSPMEGAMIRVLSGNFVTARPIGVRDGVDYGHTGEVRKVDVNAIRNVLDTGAVALIPPIGYSPTGEIFNLGAADVAGSVAQALGSEKLVFLSEEDGLKDDQGNPITNLIPSEAETRLSQQKEMPIELKYQLESAIRACRRGVKRVHLLSRRIDGVLLKELFTRDGVGCMLSAQHYEGIREASIDDVSGILELLAQLEEAGILVRRSRDLLETEINRFSVIELDGTIIGCAALYCYPGEKVAELACLAITPDYQQNNRGDDLLSHLEQRCRQNQIDQLFVLTTHTTHWFQERGFQKSDVSDLPMKRQALYNYQRNSRVFIKQI
ncbi:MAG: amino-acid N-acetyltransferase [Gammaproteobacteria bacterium]|nr:amino-acid N-acetyltransferase [Gammaproteobacteria bacterium]